jgi:molybdopterin-containing oxidoreductase family membrane subunit
VDYAILAGSFGWFSMWFLLFIKQLPVIAISEVKEIVPPKLKKSHAHGIDPSGRHFEYEADTPGEFA